MVVWVRSHEPAAALATAPGTSAPPTGASVSPWALLSCLLPPHPP
jgi:hypothetical protein